MISTIVARPNLLPTTLTLVRVENGTSTPLLRVEIAKSIFARSKGLIGRDGLPAKTGLWIEPCASIHTFFMRFPIDVLFLKRLRDGWQVLRLATNVRPWNPHLRCFGADAVLEMPVSTIAKLRIQKYALLRLLS